MCLADVAPVVGVDGSFATVELAGRLSRVSLAALALDGSDVQVGDWVLVHTGLAVELMDPAEAMEVVMARREMQEQVPGAGVGVADRAPAPADGSGDR